MPVLRYLVWTIAGDKQACAEYTATLVKAVGPIAGTMGPIRVLLPLLDGDDQEFVIDITHSMRDVCRISTAEQIAVVYVFVMQRSQTHD